MSQEIQVLGINDLFRLLGKRWYWIAIGTALSIFLGLRGKLIPFEGSQQDSSWVQISSAFRFPCALPSENRLENSNKQLHFELVYWVSGLPKNNLFKREFEKRLPPRSGMDEMGFRSLSYTKRFTPIGEMNLQIPKGAVSPNEAVASVLGILNDLFEPAIEGARRRAQRLGARKFQELNKEKCFEFVPWKFSKIESQLETEVHTGPVKFRKTSRLLAVFLSALSGFIGMIVLVVFAEILLGMRRRN